MKINIPVFEHFLSQKELIRKKLEIPAEVQVDLALDRVHGVNDLARSLADLNPHKKSIAILGAQPSPVREVAIGLGKTGFVVQEIPVSFSHFQLQSLSEAWEKLKKDTLFVLGAAVEPFTGALYPFDWIRTEASKKNIFSLIYQSPDSLKKGLIVPRTPWEGVIADPFWGEEDTLALVLKGERCHGESLLWGDPHFSDQSVENLAETLSQGRGNKEIEPEDQPAIRSFEKKVRESLSGVVKTLPDDCARLYDRAVLFVDGVNGDALCHALAQKKWEAFTSAACSWDDPHLNAWLPKLGFSPETAQSCLLVPLSVAKKEGFYKDLLAEIDRLRKISGH